MPKPVIAILGGIGSGKSALSEGLAQRRPVVVVNADRAGHQVLLDPDIKTDLRARFGPDIFRADGAVHRRALGQLVFGTTPEARQAKHDLEAIVHPGIGRILQGELAQARANPAVEAVLLDAAILLEAGWRPLCDRVVFVDTPPEIRWQRVQNRSGWTREEFLNREASQLAVGLKREQADYIVENTGQPEDAVDQFEQVYLKIMDELA